ncbi:MAG: glycosyltransferase family 39 protein [Bdellovibrionales bacterium]|nr:glycosyltransferase family 39 protein [Bdellovibrionales bacterium]
MIIKKHVEFKWYLFFIGFGVLLRLLFSFQYDFFWDSAKDIERVLHNSSGLFFTGSPVNGNSFYTPGGLYSHFLYLLIQFIGLSYEGIQFLQIITHIICGHIIFRTIRKYVGEESSLITIVFICTSALYLTLSQTFSNSLFSILFLILAYDLFLKVFVDQKSRCLPLLALVICFASQFYFLNIQYLFLFFFWILFSFKQFSKKDLFLSLLIIIMIYLPFIYFSWPIDFHSFAQNSDFSSPEFSIGGLVLGFGKMFGSLGGSLLGSNPFGDTLIYPFRADSHLPGVIIALATLAPFIFLLLGISAGIKNLNRLIVFNLGSFFILTIFGLIITFLGWPRMIVLRLLPIIPFYFFFIAFGFSQLRGTAFHRTPIIIFSILIFSSTNIFYWEKSKLISHYKKNIFQDLLKKLNVNYGVHSQNLKNVVFITKYKDYKEGYTNWHIQGEFIDPEFFNPVFDFIQFDNSLELRKCIIVFFQDDHPFKKTYLKKDDAKNIIEKLTTRNINHLDFQFNRLTNHTHVLTGDRQDCSIFKGS